jgi:hypothetical protein
LKTLKIERIGTTTERSYGRVYPYIGFPLSISPRGHETVRSYGLIIILVRCKCDTHVFSKNLLSTCC